MCKNSFTLGLCASMSLALAGMARAEMNPQTYVIQGTFSDGGTFSGTFGYDPVAGAYCDASAFYCSQGAPGTMYPFGVFNITTTPGTDGISQTYTPGYGPPATPINDSGSTSQDLSIFGGGHEIALYLSIDWSHALNGPSGSLPQPITGGSEQYDDYPLSSVVTRTITSGEITPLVPLPGAASLLALGLAGLGLQRRMWKQRVSV